MGNHRWAAAVWAISASLLGGDAAAISLGAPPGQTDQRFDAVGAFSKAYRLGLNPAHPSAEEHGWDCSATLIAPDLILTAEHCVTAYANPDFCAVRFRRHPSGSLGTVQDGPLSFSHARIVSWVFASDWGDVALGTLETPVVHIDPIPVALPATTAQWQNGSPMWFAGWGKEGPQYDEGEQDELLLCQSELLDGSNDMFEFFAADPDDSRCGLNVADDGGPLLLEATDGELRVVGCARSTTTAADLARYAGDLTFPLPTLPYGGVDLTLADPSFEATALLLPGASIDLELMVVNLGATDGAGSEAHALLSTDRTWDVGDTRLLPPLATPALAAGAVQSVDGSFELPASMPAGAFSLIAAVDAGESVAESIETNNAWQSNLPLVFVHPNPVDYDGIYVGELTAVADQAQRGYFGVYRRSDGTAAFFAFDTDEEQSYVAASVPVDGSGVVSFDIDGTVVTLDLSAEPATGQIGSELALAADREPPAGQVLHLEGYYRGTVAGMPQGEAHAVIGPSGDGYLWVDSPSFTGGFEFFQRWPFLADGFDTSGVPQLAGRFDWDELGQVHVLRAAVLDGDGLVLAMELARENTPPAPADIGAPCDDDWSCQLGNGGALAICLAVETGWHGGYCAVPGCEAGSCPPGSSCRPIVVDAASDAACLAACDPEADLCREGYACHLDGDAAADGTCQPRCQIDDDCPRPLICSETTGLCESPTPPAAAPALVDDEAEGCDCRAAGVGSSQSGWWLTVLAIAIPLLHRRRRRREGR